MWMYILVYGVIVWQLNYDISHYFYLFLVSLFENFFVYIEYVCGVFCRNLKEFKNIWPRSLWLEAKIKSNTFWIFHCWMDGFNNPHHNIYSIGQKMLDIPISETLFGINLRGFLTNFNKYRASGTT